MMPVCAKRLQWCWLTGLVTGRKCLTDSVCLIVLYLNIVSEHRLVKSVARAFQTVVAVQWKAQSAKRVLMYSVNEKNFLH